MNDLKLFVWDGFCSGFSDGLAFAVATDETEAMLLVTRQLDYDPWDWGKLTVYPLTDKIAKAVFGGT